MIVGYDDDKGTAKRLLHWGPLITFALIFGLSTGGILMVSMEWRALTGHLAGDIALQACFVGTVLFYFLQASVGSAGKVDLALIQRLAHKEEHRELWTALAKCRYCDIVKLPRSHHCKRCKRCVLKMDHHCPWINNCVGFQNEHAFILFVSSAFLTTLSTLGWYIGRLFLDPQVQLARVFIHLVSLPSRRVRYPEVLLPSFGILLVLVLLAVLVALGTGCLLWSHLASIARNSTYVEELRMEKLAFYFRVTTNNPFHNGWRQNVRQFIGPSLLAFLFPFSKRKDCDYGSFCSLVRRSEAPYLACFSEMTEREEFRSRQHTFGELQECRTLEDVN